MTHRSRNPFRRHRSSTPSEPSPETLPPDIEKFIEDYYGTKPGETYAPSPFLSVLSADLEAEEPSARYTPEQLASKLYSPQGEPITADELHAIRAHNPKYRSGHWVACDGHGGKIETTYHARDGRDRPTTPRPWQTVISQQKGTPRFLCTWPDEETAVRGHNILVNEMSIAGAVEFLRADTMHTIHKEVCEPDRPF